MALVVWEPPVGVERRFAVLHLPAAAEEMNKSRRMVALQARAFASHGGMVGVLDLRGTGDSAGEHAVATWAGWQDDALEAWAWLVSQARVPTILWGLRLGGLLAAELVTSGTIDPAALLLWQPAASGRVHFNQFLRIATAQQLTGRADLGGDAKSLRAALQRGDTVEVTGYDLNASLVVGAEAVDLARLSAPRCPILWRETSIVDPVIISPMADKTAARWRAEGSDIDVAAVKGPSFWASQEIAEAPELVQSTTAAAVSCLQRRAGP